MRNYSTRNVTFSEQGSDNLTKGIYYFCTKIISVSIKVKFAIVVQMSKLRVPFAVILRNGGGEGGAYNISVGKPEGRRPLGRPRPRWGITLR
jgi:hypothetical protein